MPPTARDASAHYTPRPRIPRSATPSSCPHQGLHFPKCSAQLRFRDAPSLRTKLGTRPEIAGRSAREGGRGAGRVPPFLHRGRNLRAPPALLWEALESHGRRMGRGAPRLRPAFPYPRGALWTRLPPRCWIPAGLRSGRGGHSRLPDPRNCGETKGSSPRLGLESHLRTRRRQRQVGGSGRKDSTSQRARGHRCLSWGRLQSEERDLCLQCRS